MDTKIQIFLSYAREDRNKVADVYRTLAAEGFAPWMDTEDIELGEEWEPTINRAIRRSDFFLVFLSATSVTKRGFLRKEINAALEIWKEKLEGDIYLIPLRLEDCPTPESLRSFHRGDLFKEDGWPRLLRSLRLGVERMSMKRELGKVVKVAENYVSPQQKSELTPPPISPSFETLLNSLHEIDNHVSPVQRHNFESHVTQMLLGVVNKLAKETRATSPDAWTEQASKWRDVRFKIEVLGRRLELLHSPNQIDFQATLMWMAECGTEEDLALLLQVETNPPFRTKEISQLIGIAKERISSRLGGQ